MTLTLQIIKLSGMFLFLLVVVSWHVSRRQLSQHRNTSTTAPPRSVRHRRILSKFFRFHPQSTFILHHLRTPFRALDDLGGAVSIGRSKLAQHAPSDISLLPTSVDLVRIVKVAMLVKALILPLLSNRLLSIHYRYELGHGFCKTDWSMHQLSREGYWSFVLLCLSGKTLLLRPKSNNVGGNQ
jgi:hypothetical protein